MVNAGEKDADLSVGGDSYRIEPAEALLVYGLRVLKPEAQCM
jgi:hypothetical protein